MKPNISELIERARKNRDELEQLFEWYLPYLRVKAKNDARLRRLTAKLDGSDIAQEALKRATAGFESFTGSTEPEFTAWMHTILCRVADDALRQFLGPTRDVNREQPLEIGSESASLMFEPIDDERSAGSGVIKGEQALQLAAALERLPEDQRKAVQMKHLERLSLKDIAALLGKSEPAVGGLLRRGTARLRELMRE